MATRLEDVTLRDVHLALGAPALVSLGFREDRPECLVDSDAARAAGNVALAVADGAMAGVAAHRSTMS